MYTILSITFIFIYLITKDPINLYAAVGFSIASGLYNIGLNIHNIIEEIKKLREKNRLS